MDWKSIFFKVIFISAISSTVVFAAVPDPPHDRAALVNGAAITAADFHVELGRLERLRGVKKGAAPADMARLKKEALENLIARELLYQEAGKLGIRIPENEAAAEMNGLRKHFTSMPEYEITLGRMGLSEAQVREQVEKGMAARRLIEEKFGSKVKVTDADIEFYYEDHRDEFRIAGGKPAAYSPLHEVREKIRRKIREERIDRELNPYLKRLRDEAKVVILLDGEGD